MACHLSPFISVPFLLPFIVYLVKRGESELVAAHAKEALNFHITLFLYAIICTVLCVVMIGFLLFAVLGVMAIVCPIIAAVRASEGGFYRYPLTLRLF